MSVGTIRFVRHLGHWLILIYLGELYFHSGVSRVQRDEGGLFAFLRARGRVEYLVLWGEGPHFHRGGRQLVSLPRAGPAQFEPGVRGSVALTPGTLPQ